MKNIFLVFLFCTLCFKTNAQIDIEFTSKNHNSSSIPYIVHTPTVLPQYPAINTPVKILILVTSGTAVSKTNISYNLNLQQNIIDINACYYCFPATVPSYIKDTVNIGLLPAETYTVNLKTYRTSSPTVCINKIDSTSIIDTSFTISSNVRINENINSKNFISIYPNPIENILNVEFETEDLKEVKLKITNTLGQLVYSLNDPNKKQKIDLSFLVPGIYYIKVQNNSKQKIFKIIKE